MNANGQSREALPASALRQCYAPLPGVWDEMMAADFELRPHWRPLIDGLEVMSREELTRRWRIAERLRHENGLTYSLDVSSVAAERPWDLDFVPFVIGADEWRDLSLGLAQRARLLNALLADLYGPQTLLHDRHIPAALVYANPHFLRPCHGIKPKNGVYLNTYAVDLGRGANGRWQVLADRTQAPTGLGFALENRIVLSRCLPELFRSVHIHRLAAFFQAQHDGLVALTARENPRIVLLSSGPANEGYFAEAYLARYLGYSLAEGGDLTVRDNRVYLKSVDGLKLVDLVLRRVDSEDCDPLELSSRSSLGVAGLLQALRTGSVTVANAPGSGVAEARALMNFLPEICRVLLGEELKIASTPTRWCGLPDHRRFVLENFDTLAIDSAFERRTLLSTAGMGSFGGELSPKERTRLIGSIERRGHEYVGQEPALLSTTPVWVNGHLTPRPMALRVFLAAKGDDYIVMPGGLARIAGGQDARAVALSRGAGTKDTWILTEEPVSQVTLLRSPLSYVKPQRIGKDLPSRAADNLFWLGRYSERTEDTMRILRSCVRRLTEDASPVDELPAMQRVLNPLIEKGEESLKKEAVPTVGRSLPPMATLTAHLSALMFDPSVPYGLQETLGDLLRTASLVRDRLSVDAWRTLSHLCASASVRPGEPIQGVTQYTAQALELLDNGLRSLAAFSGMEMENMTRNHGWRFLDMGRRAERAVHLTELLGGLLTRGDPESDGSLILLLEVADSFMTYRSRYLTTPMIPPVIDLLLLDETNPRSVAFQMAALAEHVDQLPRDADLDARSAEQRIALLLLTTIRLAEIAELCKQDADGRRRALEELLDQIHHELPRLTEILSREYFSLADIRRPADL